MLLITVHDMGTDFQEECPQNQRGASFPTEKLYHQGKYALNATGVLISYK